MAFVGAAADILVMGGSPGFGALVDVWVDGRWAASCVVPVGTDTDGRGAYWFHLVSGSVEEVVAAADGIRAHGPTVDGGNAPTDEGSETRRPVDTDLVAAADYQHEIVRQICTCHPQWPALEVLLEGRRAAVYRVPCDDQGPVSALAYAYCAGCGAQFAGGWRLTAPVSTTGKSADMTCSHWIGRRRSQAWCSG